MKIKSKQFIKIANTNIKQLHSKAYYDLEIIDDNIIMINKLSGMKTSSLCALDAKGYIDFNEKTVNGNDLLSLLTYLANHHNIILTVYLKQFGKI